MSANPRKDAVIDRQPAKQATANVQTIVVAIARYRGLSRCATHYLGFRLTPPPQALCCRPHSRAEFCKKTK
ncbi:MAG: hypothetical protein JST84_31560 [Acidobacteria bacterium]|nr:hypothetical protein [Acidobacteriota bacterium]